MTTKKIRTSLLVWTVINCVLTAVISLEWRQLKTLDKDHQDSFVELPATRSPLQDSSSSGSTLVQPSLKVGDREIVETVEDILVPRSVLKHIHRPAFFGYGINLDDQLAEDLYLDSNEVELIERACSKALDELSLVESTVMKRRIDNEGGDYFLIPAFAERGEQIRLHLLATLSKVVSPGKSAILIEAIGKSKTFNGFGGRSRELSILEKQSSNGEPMYYWEIAELNEDGLRSSGSANRVTEAQIDEIRTRFGRLFDKEEAE